jgi:hypothetical protein
VILHVILLLVSLPEILADDRASTPKAPETPLQPLLAYAGTWNWQWQDEHGRPMGAHSMVTVDPAGAFIIDRVSELEEGKVAPTELNIYYWRAEAKTIGGVGFTSSGAHGTATLFVRGNQWIEQSSGYDEDGAFRTHVDRWEWLNRDTAVYQETQVVHGGRPEPDGFKLDCRRALSNPPVSARGGETNSVNPHLKWLAPLLGHWDVQWTNANQEVKTAQARVELELGGAAILQTLHQVDGEKLVDSQLTVYYWQPELKSVGVVTLRSSGSSWAGSLFVRTGGWSSQLAGYDGEARAQTRFGQWRWLADDSAVYQTSHGFTAGQPEPDSPPYRFVRARPHSVQGE